MGKIRKNSKGTSDKVTKNINGKQSLRNKSLSRRDYRSKEEIRFSESLSSLGLEIKVMEGDGNCLFRAIADQIERNQEMHLMYRRLIIEYITTNKEHFIPYMEDDEPFDDYVARMMYARCFSCILTN